MNTQILTDVTLNQLGMLYRSETEGKSYLYYITQTDTI